MQYVRNLNQPIAQAANVANALQSTAAVAERVFEFIHEEEELQGAKTHANPINLKEIKTEVTFENLSFGYSKNSILIKTSHLLQSLANGLPSLALPEQENNYSKAPNAFLRGA